MVTRRLWLSPQPPGLDLGGPTGFALMHGINQGPKASKKSFISKKPQEKNDHLLANMDLSEVASQLLAYSSSVANSCSCGSGV